MTTQLPTLRVDQWVLSLVINTDKAPTYAAALAELRKEGKGPKDTLHRQVRYLSNRLEADHGKPKRLIKPTLGFRSLRTAFATLKGFEGVRALRKGRALCSATCPASQAR